MKNLFLGFILLTGCSDMWFNSDCIQKIRIRNVEIDPNDKVPDNEHSYITHLNLQILDAEDESLIHEYTCENDQYLDECRLMLMKVCYEDLDTIWRFHIEQTWNCVIDEDVLIEAGTDDLDFEVVNVTAFYDNEIRCNLLVDK